MKTQDLADFRKEEKISLDDTKQFYASKYQLDQYNQVKKILSHFCFKYQSKNVLSPEIILDVMDEIRSERKITMVLQDKNVDEYIETDITDINMTKISKDPSLIESDESAYDLKT